MFVLAGIILNITPGSDTIYILSRSIAQGRRAGVFSVLGISSGCGVHTLLAALGLSVVLAQSAVAFLAVKLAGALYLGYLGLTTLVSGNGALALEGGADLSAREIYLQGLMTNVLNPKVALFFLSLLPQFVDPSAGYGILPFLILGGTFLTTGTIWCLLLVVFSAAVTAFLRQSEQAARWMNRVCGSIYLLLGLKVLTAER